MKLLFFDVDGTLLNRWGRVPHSAARALHLTQQKGNKVIINSGRCLGAIPKAIVRLGPDGYVCGCGTGVYLEGKTLFHQSLPPHRCQEIFRECRRAKLEGQMEGEQTTWVDRCIGTPWWYLAGIRLNFGSHVKMVGRDIPQELEFDKFFLVGRSRLDWEYLKQLAGPEMEIICREHGSAEIVPANCSKATGMELIRQTLGVPLEDCFAFGDSNNDIPMLEYAGHAIAMGNLNGDILDYCEYQTTDINRDGIWNALKHYDLI